MNMKKALPVIFLIVLVVIALALKRWNAAPDKQNDNIREENTSIKKQNNKGQSIALDRNTTELFFTKHARCRMKCRQITQQEVKDILVRGKVNYNKSELDERAGPTYAVEGITDDRQHVRIIFAPRQKHLTVVTVIDLDTDHQCDC
jgi:hypothetical protein